MPPPPPPVGGPHVLTRSHFSFERVRYGVWWGRDGTGRYMDSMQQHRAGDSGAIPDLALDANGDVGPDFAVVTNLGGGVHDVVAHKLGAGC